MNEKLKSLLRKGLNGLHLDLTQNLKYDRLTKAIIAEVVKPDTTCIDIGAHKGEILDLFLHYAPRGRHYAFEPVPALYRHLVQEYSPGCAVFPVALSDEAGKTTFQFVRNAPAYSGIQKRRYEINDPDIEEIEVDMNTLDAILDDQQKVGFIKIDVEGAELKVLRGAEKTIGRNKPYVIFECGLGASDYYGTQPEEVYRFFSEKVQMHVSTLQDFLKNEHNTLSEEQFCNHYRQNTEYYFLAHA